MGMQHDLLELENLSTFLGAAFSDYDLAPNRILGK